MRASATSTHLRTHSDTHLRAHSHSHSRLYRTLIAGVLAAGLMGSGSGDPYKALPGAYRKAAAAGNAEIEQSLGNVLQTPVFQCGTGADTLTADAAPASVSVFESGPVRPIALSADGQRLYVAMLSRLAPPELFGVSPCFAQLVDVAEPPMFRCISSKELRIRERLADRGLYPIQCKFVLLPGYTFESRVRFPVSERARIVMFEKLPRRRKASHRDHQHCSYGEV